MEKKATATAVAVDCWYYLHVKRQNSHYFPNIWRPMRDTHSIWEGKCQSSNIQKMWHTCCARWSRVICMLAQITIALSVSISSRKPTEIIIKPRIEFRIRIRIQMYITERILNTIWFMIGIFNRKKWCTC